MTSSTILLDTIQIEIGGDNEWPDDARLFQPYETEQILMPDSANCLAVQAFLQMAGLKYEVVYKANAAEMSPTGRVPFIKVGQYLIAELEPIVAFVQSKNISLTSNLTDAEKSDMRAYMSLITTVLGNAENYVTWCDSETYNKVTKKRFGSVYPFPLNLYLLWKKRSATIERMKALGGKTEEELVLDEVELCCQSLADRLGDNEFFFKSGPTELDCLLFAHIYTILNWPSLLLGNRLAQILCKYPNLVYHGSQLKKCVCLHRNDVLNVYEPLMTAYHKICSAMKEKSVASTDSNFCQKCQDIVESKGSDFRKVTLCDRELNSSSESLSSDMSSSIKSNIVSTLCEIKAFTQNSENQIYRGAKPNVKIDPIALSRPDNCKNIAEEVVSESKSKQALHVRIQENNNSSDLLFEEGENHENEQVKNSIHSKNASLPSVVLGVSGQESRRLYPALRKDSFLPLDSPFLMKCHQLFNPCRSLVTMMRTGSVNSSSVSERPVNAVKVTDQNSSSPKAKSASEEVIIAEEASNIVSNLVDKNSQFESSVLTTDMRTKKEDSNFDATKRGCLKVGGNSNQADASVSSNPVLCESDVQKIKSCTSMMHGKTEVNESIKTSDQNLSADCKTSLNAVGHGINYSKNSSRKCDSQESSSTKKASNEGQSQESKESLKLSCDTKDTSLRENSHVVKAEKSSMYVSDQTLSADTEDDSHRKSSPRRTQIPIPVNISKENCKDLSSIVSKPATPSKPQLVLKKTAVKNVKDLCSPHPKPDIQQIKEEDSITSSDDNQVKLSIGQCSSGMRAKDKQTSRISPEKKFQLNASKIVSKTQAFARVGQDMKQFSKNTQVIDHRNSIVSGLDSKSSLLASKSVKENKLLCKNTLNTMKDGEIVDYKEPTQSMTCPALNLLPCNDAGSESEVAVKEVKNYQNPEENDGAQCDPQMRSDVKSKTESCQLNLPKNSLQEKPGCLLNQNASEKSVKCPEDLRSLSVQLSSQKPQIKLSPDCSFNNTTVSTLSEIQNVSANSAENKGAPCETKKPPLKPRENLRIAKCKKNDSSDNQ